MQCGEHTREITGGEPSTTNNRMELRAIVAGLEAIKAAAEITVYADSLYAIGAFTGNKIKKNADLITAGLLKIEAIKQDRRNRDLPARQRPCRRSPQRTVRQARPPTDRHPKGSVNPCLRLTTPAAERKTNRSILSPLCHLDAVMRLHVTRTDPTYQATLDYLDPDMIHIFIGSQTVRQALIIGCETHIAATYC